MLSTEFAELATKWGRFTRWVNRVAIAVRKPDGWELQYAFTAFAPIKIDASNLFLKTDAVFAGREVSEFPFDQAEKIVGASILESASVEIGGEKFELPNKGGRPFQYYNPISLPRMAGPQRLPSIVSTRHGAINTGYPRIDKLELELRASPTPFENFTDLFTDMGLPFLMEGWGGWSSQRTEITIAPPVFFDSVELKSGKLSCYIKGSGLINKAAVSAAFKLFPVDQQKIQRKPFSGEVIWVTVDGALIGRLDMPAENIGLVQAFLNYEGEFVGAWWARDATISFSQRSALHRSFDEDWVFSRKFFDDRNSFEDSVTVLLSLLNLDCLFYGRIADLKDGPDILASSSQGHLYVVECSTGDINSRGKLRRLFERTNDIRAKLASSHFRPREILPVAITSVPHRETLHCIDELQNYGIAVIAREGIESLLRQIEAPPTPDQLFASALASVPKPVTPIPDQPSNGM